MKNYKLLEELCSAFGPSGMEDEVREIVIREIKDHCDSYKVDKVGNVVAFKKGKKNTGKTVLLSAHMDEVGFMVRYISDKGYAYFEEVGGVEPAVVGGKRVVIGDNRTFGVVCSKAIHLQKPEERGVCIPIEEMYIDMGFESKEEAEKHIAIGDEVTFAPNFSEFGNGCIKSKALDDRVGCFVLIELLKRELPCDTYFAFVTCEENGFRGSIPLTNALKPDISIVIETTTCADLPDTPYGEECCKFREGAVISHMDGCAIYDKELFALTLKTLKEKGIKHQVKNFVAGGNDSKAYQQYAGGCKIVAISAPVRYLHSPTSVACLSDIEDVTEAAAAVLEVL